MPGPTRLNRSLIRVSGPDAASFLDNLLTQDVNRLGEAGVLYAALLSPQGKVLADMMLWPDGDAVLIDADPARGSDLLRRLTMYKLRAQVTLEDVSASRFVLVADAPFGDARPDPRLVALGWRAIGIGDAPPAEWYDANRLALGVPDLARDAGVEEVFALEALLEELNGVDFQKGCFVGQENVSRMKRRATTRKKFCPIVFEGAAPESGAPITAGGAELGTIRTGAQGRAMALLRLDRAFEALEAARTLEAAGQPVRLDPPPWLILPQRENAS